MVPLILLVALTADPTAKPPAMKELFANQPWYKEQTGKEESFTGTLRYHPLPAGVDGLGRHNDFSLEILAGGKKTTYEVYSGGKAELFKPYAGKKITLTGKRVDIEVIGRVHKEIWPARLKVVPPLKAEPPAPPG